MLSSRSIYTLSLSERHALRRQWLRSGQCLRCFHASTSRSAADENRGKDVVHNAPQRGPTRQQRAAMISEEVKMIQRDHPLPTFSEPDLNTLRPAGAGKTVDPEAVGENVTPGRMGENDTRTQEGPLAQGVGRVVDAEENVQDTSKRAQGIRTPHDAVGEPVQGAPAVLNVVTGSRKSRGERDMKSSKATRKQPAAEAKQLNPSVTEFREALISGKYNTSTIAGGRFESVIADHVSQATGQAKPPKKKTRRDPTPWSILRKIVAGKYDNKHYLSGAALKQPALKEIARATSMNATYMPKDTGHFFAKVRSLLPPSPAQRARQQAGQEASKAA